MNKKSPVKSKKIKVPLISTKEYAQALLAVKKQMLESQTEAISSVNIALNKRNWLIGKIIVEKQNKHKWGSNFIEKLAKDMQNMAPGSEGFSIANIYRMKAFYEAYENIIAAAIIFEKIPIFRIPWFHNVAIIQNLKNQNERLWYAQKAIEYGWSRSALEDWIKSDVYCREGKAITNFTQTLPAPHSAMAQQSFKDPLILDFLTLRDDYLEKDLEQNLIDNIQKFLLELGEGFAFIGRQHHLEVGDQDYYIDLLFYHVKLRCYVVIELKNTAFKPEYAGKLNFYLSAVDDLLRHPDDKPTIGLILCKTKNNFTAEYALRDINKPIGISNYTTKLVEKLPKEFKNSLPTIQEIEAELEKQEILASAQKTAPTKKEKTTKKPVAKKEPTVKKKKTVKKKSKK